MMKQSRWLKRLSVTALAGGLLLALVACGGGSDSGAVSDPADGSDAVGAGEAAHQEDAVAEDGDHMDGGMADAHDGAQEILVVPTDSFTYEPGDITVKVGQAVHLTLDNTDSVLLHDLSVELLAANVVSEGAEHDHGAGAAAEPADDMHMHDDAAAHEDEADSGVAAVHVAADAGGMGHLEFTPTEPGVYVFYCSVPGHREAGMEGTITVES